jgi:hypothetical protein
LIGWCEHVENERAINRESIISQEQVTAMRGKEINHEPELIKQPIYHYLFRTTACFLYGHNPTLALEPTSFRRALGAFSTPPPAMLYTV